MKEPLLSNSTQNDWADAFREKFEGKNVPLNSVHPMMIDSQIIHIQKLLADARREVIEKVEKMINTKYPPNLFTEYTANPNVMTMSRGVAESTHIRRLSPSEVGHIEFLDHVLATLREEGV